MTGHSEGDRGSRDEHRFFFTWEKPSQDKKKDNFDCRELSDIPVGEMRMRCEQGRNFRERDLSIMAGDRGPQRMREG